MVIQFQLLVNQDNYYTTKHRPGAIFRAHKLLGHLAPGPGILNKNLVQAFFDDDDDDDDDDEEKKHFKFEFDGQCT